MNQDRMRYELREGREVWAHPPGHPAWHLATIAPDADPTWASDVVAALNLSLQPTSPLQDLQESLERRGAQPVGLPFPRDGVIMRARRVVDRARAAEQDALDMLRDLGAPYGVPTNPIWDDPPPAPARRCMWGFLDVDHRRGLDRLLVAAPQMEPHWEGTGCGRAGCLPVTLDIGPKGMEIDLPTHGQPFEAAPSASPIVSSEIVSVRLCDDPACRVDHGAAPTIVTAQNRCTFVTGHDSIVGDWQCALPGPHDGAHQDPVGRPHVELLAPDGGEDGRNWTVGAPWNMPVRLIHCDPLVLHAPTAGCEYCNRYGQDLQARRAAGNVAFTKPNDGRSYCEHGIPLGGTRPAPQPCPFHGVGPVVPDPAETNRPGGVHQEWGGNRPARRPVTERGVEA